MNDKERDILDLSSTLVLRDEVNNIKPNDKKNEILKINNLVKTRYLLKRKTVESVITKDIDKNFIEIKNTAQKINDDIRDQTLQIKNSIKNQKKELKSIYDKKNPLYQNWLKLNQSKYAIKSEIISKQLELIKTNKEDNEKLKSYLLDVKANLESNKKKIDL